MYTSYSPGHAIEARLSKERLDQLMAGGVQRLADGLTTGRVVYDAAAG